MSKRTISLIIILIFITGVLLVLAFSTPSSTTYIQAQPTPVLSEIIPETSLFFGSPRSISPASIDIASQSAKITSIPIMVTTGNNMITAVQIELSYDPNVLTNVSVENGTFFMAPAIFVNEVDEKNGRIYYALGINPQERGKQGKDVVVNLHFQSKTQSLITTEITFLAKTLVTAEGTTKSVLNSATPIEFVIGQNLRY